MAWAWSKIAAGQVPGGPAAGLVLLRLADRADPEGKCWPGHQRTAADLNLAESTVRTSIKGLEMAGLMEIKPREIDGRCASNLYILAVDNLDSQPCDRVPKSGTRVPKNAGMGVPKSGTEPTTTTEPPIKRECAQSAHSPAGRRARSGRGALSVDQGTGLQYSPDDPRDESALRRIHGFPADVVRRAVAAAAELDPAGRPFPSATLRILLQQQSKSQTQADTPAWARRESHNDNINVIEGDLQWTE